MERKKETFTEKRQGDWVRDQLRLSLQLLAAQAQDQIHHFPPHVAIIEEMIMDSVHFAESIHTFWTFSQKQTRRLTALRDFLRAQDNPQYGDFWDEEALFTDLVPTRSVLWQNRHSHA